MGHLGWVHTIAELHFGKISLRWVDLGLDPLRRERERIVIDLPLGAGQKGGRRTGSVTRIGNAERTGNEIA